jgi:hypothetical protein
MLRKAVGLALALAFLGGMVAADAKEKGKKLPKPSNPEFAKAVKDSKKATVTKVDHKKKMLSVKAGDKTTDYTVSKDTKFWGPQGGKASFKDKRLKVGSEVGIVADGKTLKAVILPRAKGKEKPKKEKDKKGK